MTKLRSSALLRRLGFGLLAGAVAGLALALTSLLLRILAGVPLIAEVAGDRVIPTIDVHTFVRLLGRVGGPLRGKSLSFMLSFVGEVVVGAVVGMVFAAVAGRSSGDRRPWRRWVAVLIGATLFAWLLAIVLVGPALSSNYIGLPSPWAAFAVILGLALELGVFVTVLLLATRGTLETAPAAAEPGDEVEDPAGERAVARSTTIGRRAVLLGGAGALGIAATAWLARSLYDRATFGDHGYDGLMVRGPHTSPITSNEDFYCVTKNLIDPRVAQSRWRLRIDGSVERPATYAFNDLRALPSVEQIQTLECISNGIGSGLMSNANWTGVTLGSLIETAGPRPSVAWVVLHAADGYVAEMSLDKAMEPTTIVAYAMNGVPLPDRHGSPARVLVPGTYGEVSVKWVDGIRLSATPTKGYYERQGWRANLVQTTSRFDRPVRGQIIALGQTPEVALGGVAFAGDRGISSVTWSADGGVSWHAARVTYAPSKIAWSLWEATWSPRAPGTYRLLVRAVDGDGELQTDARHGVVPAGASGLHEVVVTVRP